MSKSPETIIAHLTDIHFPQNPKFSLSEISLKRFFGFMNWHFSRKKMHLSQTVEAISKDVLDQKFNHMIVSGDLVNLTLRKEYEAGFQWMKQFGQTNDLSFVPGNHDYYGKNLSLYPEQLQNSSKAEKERGGELLPYMTSDMRGEALGGAKGPDLPFVRVVNDVALIGLNSGVPTPLFKAYGAINKKSLEVLAQILTAAEKQGLFRCVILHHPPLSGITRSSRGLQNDHELTSLLEEHGAELVLYGHNHKQHHVRLNTASGVCHVIGTPSASIGFDSRYELARYNLFSIQNSATGWALKMRGRGLKDNYGEVVDLGTTDLV